ncbi:MAG TPA: acetolactate synthase small subunit [Firmicutes bacterium]|jgi:acetolactate synthase I/III small subunit|nr:acetolactate synthase small subunit [Bacillota bacterium]
MRHIISALVVNHSGVMSRVAGLFSRRGYNIESIAVGHSEEPDQSRMIIVVDADEDQVVEQIEKQLYKLVDVVKVNDIPPGEAVVRELAMIKVNAGSQNRAEVLQIVDIFRAKVVDVSSRAVVVEITGSSDKIEALIALLRPFGIREIVRAGQIAMVRTAKKGEK